MPTSLQTTFLKALRKERRPVVIYLVNGLQLQGHIDSFDQYVVLLTHNVSQMVYRHAISRVVPARDMNSEHEVHIRREAARWYAWLDTDADDNDRQQFESWLRADERHREAYLNVDRLSGVVMAHVLSNTRIRPSRSSLDGETSMQDASGSEDASDPTPVNPRRDP